MRIGQKNSLVYQWAKTGSRPRQPKDQRYENAYMFGAVCPGRDTGVALIMPLADTEAMQAHLDAIGEAVAPGAHALLILDKAGWHTNLRNNYLGNRVFTSYEAILDACQDAWRKLLAETGRITSIAHREWAMVGQSF